MGYLPREDAEAIFLSRDPGNYRIAVTRRSQNEITLQVAAATVAANNFDALMRI